MMNWNVHVYAFVCRCVCGVQKSRTCRLKLRSKWLNVAPSCWSFLYYNNFIFSNFFVIFVLDWDLNCVCERTLETAQVERCVSTVQIELNWKKYNLIIYHRIDVALIRWFSSFLCFYGYSLIQNLSKHLIENQIKLYSFSWRFKDITNSKVINV